MVLTFVTFTNKSYMSSDRIVQQAKEFNLFNNILQLNEDDIHEFIIKHHEFIKNNPPGYGRWIWKPKIIYDTLLKLNDNDIIFYADAGTFLNIKGIDRFKYYLDLLNNEKVHLITFSTNSIRSRDWVKNDAVMHYYPSLHEENILACYAGIMLIKKNDKSINLIKDWLELCENYHFLDQSRSINYSEKEYYRGNDGDNGLFNLCLCKHKISHTIYPDETNIYIGNEQIHHTGHPITNDMWKVLDDKPIQVRRLVPNKPWSNS